MKKFFKSHVKLCIAVLALSLVTVGATLALMVSASNSVTNNFTAADIDTEIHETLTKGNKQVSIYNNGPSDAYVRARIMVSGVKTTDVVIVDSATEADDPDKVYLVMNADDTQNPWKWQKDGDAATYSDDFYYYLDVLQKGQSTNKLLEKVVVGENLQTDEFLSNFTVTIYHESVLAIDQSAPISVEKVKSAFDAAAGSTTNP